MKTCKYCNQEIPACICDKVDAFFDGVRHLMPIKPVVIDEVNDVNLLALFEEFVSTDRKAG